MEIQYADFRKMHEPIKADLKRAMNEVYENQWFIQGEKLAAFEEAFAEYCGANFCVGTGNGLDALRLMLQAFDIGPGDEVIVPSHTYIATALAVNYVGATPVFVEPERNTLLIDPALVEKAVTDRTKAILVVHLYGRIANIKPIKDIAEHHGLMLFEDAAQAHGGQTAYGNAGALGNAAAFSFYPGKNLGAFGDAGAVVTDDKDAAEKIRALGNYGSDSKYHHIYKGVNSRMDEIQAAILLEKLKHLDEWTKERKRIAKRYYDGLAGIPGIELPEYTEENVYHIFPILSERRDELQTMLLENGVHTLIHYPIPMHLQEAYADLGFEKGSFPIAEAIADKELSLPLYPGITDEEIDYIISHIVGF